MSKAKTLAHSNVYLRDAATRQRTVMRSVASSSAIEGIRAPFKDGSVSSKPTAKPNAYAPKR